jgi:uncharacterized membrane protein YeaQ/YmgE (transglycosylase-associated protein family)
MGIIGWIVLGGLAGWIASMFAGTNKSQGLFGNIIVGIIGAVIGGWVVGLFGIDGVNGFNFWSLLVAVIGAFITLSIWKVITGRKSA